jgi:hypothetical protein
MYKLRNLIDESDNTQCRLNGKWVPARPVRLFGIWHDLKDAWAVFTRKADAFTWPEGQ